MAHRTVDEVGMWEQFYTDGILTVILDYTNKNIDRYILLSNDRIDSQNYTYVKRLDMIELRAYIGLMVFANKKNLMSVEDLFMHESSPDHFQATMAYRRFYFLSHFLSFDNYTTRVDRYKEDKYACYREVFELLNKRNAIMRTPSSHLTIDGTLYPYRGQIGIKVYNPSKPARHGLLIISISDAEVPYTYFNLPYAGKATGAK